MTIGLVVDARNATLNDIRDRIDAGPGAGELRLYTSPRPATGGAATTLLGACAFSDPSAPDAANGTMTFNAVSDDSSAPNGGTATWARVVDSTGAFVMDLTVGLSGSPAEVIVNTTTVAAGGIVRVDSVVLNTGNS